jgi:branched-chain amino acid transport system ATP-binding protein
MIKISDLTVRFGGVTSLDGVSISFPAGICGLIGPNGAGKTTFFNVLSGFVVPADGSVQVGEENLLAIPHFRRARWGLRRTFQTEQTIASLSAFDNVAMVLEHAGASRSGRREAVHAALEFAGLRDHSRENAGTLDTGARRLLELARAVVGQPRLILLDEPAAGLPDEETAHLGQLIQAIPGTFGAQVILVDHDMSVVSSCCEITAVLDFGRLIASGPTGEVLLDPRVISAYLGEADRV